MRVWLPCPALHIPGQIRAHAVTLAVPESDTGQQGLRNIRTMDDNDEHRHPPKAPLKDLGLFALECAVKDGPEAWANLSTTWQGK